MAGSLYLDKKVCDLRVWELYVGFVILQLLIGIVIAFIQGIFDMTGIKGALSAVVNQLGMVSGARMPQNYLKPVAAEIREGNYFSSGREGYEN
tara:strand:+ start:417 stop:695 length:279 start_codon:yes stop_codon:yes gene_type:complete